MKTNNVEPKIMKKSTVDAFGKKEKRWVYFVENKNWNVSIIELKRTIKTDSISFGISKANGESIMGAIVSIPKFWGRRFMIAKHSKEWKKKAVVVFQEQLNDLNLGGAL